MEYLELAQLFVREVAQKIGFTGNALVQIDIAIEESVSNIMKYGYDAEESQTIDILCQNIAGGIKIILKEMGIPFDPNRIARFNLTKNLEEMSFEGMGIYMIQQVMDDLSFHNLGHRGKETHMIKYLPESAVETKVLLDLDATSGETDGPTEPVEFFVRGLEPHEAIEVSKCAYISHGYSFFDDHIYYPERLIEMNQTEEMLSAVAVTKDGHFMGHCALVFQDPGDSIAELTFAFVNQEYRGQGALNKLNAYLFTLQPKRKLTGIYAYAVANHVFTQKSMLKNQINDCGILLATSPSQWKFKGISDDTSQRISVILGFRYKEIPEPRDLYAPEHHKDMIGKLLGNIGSPHQLAIPAVAPLGHIGQTTGLVTKINELESCGEIYLESYGEDYLNAVRKALRHFCVNRIEAINLFLPLADALTYYKTKEIEQMGFFFAGVLPDTFIGDALILQYLNNIDFDYNKLVLYLDFTKELLAYIRNLDPNADLQ